MGRRYMRFALRYTGSPAEYRAEKCEQNGGCERTRETGDALTYPILSP